MACAIESVSQPWVGGDQFVHPSCERFGKLGQGMLLRIPIEIDEFHRAGGGFEGVELVIVEDGQSAGGFVVGLVGRHMPERSVDHKEHFDKFMRMEIVLLLKECGEIFNGQARGFQMRGSLWFGLLG